MARIFYFVMYANIGSGSLADQPPVLGGQLGRVPSKVPPKLKTLRIYPTIFVMDPTQFEKKYVTKGNIQFRQDIAF